MNQEAINEIHRTLGVVHDTLGSLTSCSCDQDDVNDLIERVESELSSGHPNVQVIDTFLNSIARSLRTEPGARDACLQIEETLERAGLPSTWQNGV